MEKIACKICGSTNHKPFVKVPDRFDSGMEFEIVKCECGFVFLNPRPALDEIGKYYEHESYDPHKSQTKTLFDFAYRFVQTIALTWKKKTVERYISRGRLLDIGGGAGEFCQHMAKYGWDVTVQDTSPEALALAERRGVLGVKSLDALKKSAKYDLITMWHALEHIHDIDALYGSSIDGMLKPGGVLVVAVPNHNAPERKYFGKSWAPYDAPRHLYHFDLECLTRIQNKYGFEIIGAHSLYQDTPYNILLSSGARDPKSLIRMAAIWIKSLSENIRLGVSHSSSMMVVARRTQV